MSTSTTNEPALAAPPAVHTRAIIVDGHCDTPYRLIRHNLHHAETNVEETDPDLENKLVAFTDSAAREKRGLARFIVRWQAYIFPVLATIHSPLRWSPACGTMPMTH